MFGRVLYLRAYGNLFFEPVHWFKPLADWNYFAIGRKLIFKLMQRFLSGQIINGKYSLKILSIKEKK